MTDYTDGGNQITDAHRQLLLDSAITPEVIESSGITSSPDGTELLFPWNDGTSATVWQRRPDAPRMDADGKPIKYEFAKGARVPFNRLRDGDDYSQVLICEGTKQSYAALSHAPAAFAVYGMSGCWGFQNADLSVLAGRDVFLLPDADYATNIDVWTAAEKLTKLAKTSGAKSFRYVGTTGKDKQGVDDVLAEMPEDKRGPALRMWLSTASDKLGRRPKAKQSQMDETDTKAAELFRRVDNRMLFQPVDAARRLMDRAPAAITMERNIAMYRGGVYGVHQDDVLAAVVGMLGNFYSPNHMASVKDALIGQLHLEGKRLPERMAEPLLNCPNGMVDLRTGDVLAHDPAYMSYVQVTTEYRPDMATPVYDAWLREALRKQGYTDVDVAALVADLEETAGSVLDPSKTPSKALFLFGPSRSGKSTFLRLLKAIAGAVNTSAVTLHQLSDDQFAAANLYGKMLNVAADLSNKDVSDLSNFKMLTGEDVVQANRKYGQHFSFTNQALFAFSANELPNVSEGSRAYIARIKPFNFPNSFEGREDSTLEDRLMAELPGILARWVKAYGRVIARGGYAASDAATVSDFEAKSDRVSMFVRDMCVITPAEHGKTLDSDQCSTASAIRTAFNEWAERNGGKPMGLTSLKERLLKTNGVTEVKNPKRARCLNISVKPVSADELWPEDEPAAQDGFEAAASAPEDPKGNPWSPAAPKPCDVCGQPVDAALPGTVHPTCEAQPVLVAVPAQRDPAADPFAAGLDLAHYEF